MNEDHIRHLDFIKGIPQHPQKSQQWLEQRVGRLTSSDAATALGINPYKKPVELLLEKCGSGKKFTGNEATEHGNKYEDEAIDKYAKLMGKENHTFGLISFESLDKLRLNKDNSKKYVDVKYSFLAGSPDGIAIDITNSEKLLMLEVKCPMRRKIKHGQIPSYYYPQVQLNMFILDLDIADFIEYIPGPQMELNIVRVQRSDEWLEKNMPILQSFWENVLDWKQRDITTHPEYNKYYQKPTVAKICPDFLFIDTDEERPSSSSSIIDINMFE